MWSLRGSFSPVSRMWAYVFLKLISYLLPGPRDILMTFYSVMGWKVNVTDNILQKRTFLVQAYWLMVRHLRPFSYFQFLHWTEIYLLWLEIFINGRLGTGWSMHTSETGSAMRSSQLTFEEQEHIMQVIRQAELLERTEMERIGLATSLCCGFVGRAM